MYNITCLNASSIFSDGAAMRDWMKIECNCNLLHARDMLLETTGFINMCRNGFAVSHCESADESYKWRLAKDVLLFVQSKKIRSEEFPSGIWLTLRHLNARENCYQFGWLMQCVHCDMHDIWRCVGSRTDLFYSRYVIDWIIWILLHDLAVHQAFLEIARGPWTELLL